MKKESLATKRARERGYFNKGPEWYCEFKEEDCYGDFVPEEGIHRRDPSSVILVDGTYYTWYTKSYGEHVGFGTGDLDAKVFQWDQAEIWYASSKDGKTWKEEGLAVDRGEKGSYDERSVFTPEVLHHDGKFCLVYQVVENPYVNRVKEKIAIATADNPHGPWTKSPAPILEPSNDGEWEGTDDNRFAVKKQGSFDSHKTHDPVLFFYNDKFYLYYKGEPMGEKMYMGGRETKWGVAIADKAEGPYIKSEYNPISNSGHETLLWKYKNGIAACLCTDGMERNTMQFAKDGINFEIMGAIKFIPEACGPFRDGKNEVPLDGLDWGLTHMVHCKWNYIRFFRRDESLKKHYLERTNYE